jgi:DUF4097 and DUF4098 domain-containing protein YvlB
MYIKITVLFFSFFLVQLGNQLYGNESYTPFTGIQKIDMDLSAVDVSVKNHEKSEVGLTIVLSKRLQDEGLRINYSKNGSTLEIRVKIKANSLSFNNDEAKIALLVPSNLTFHGESMSGDAEFAGISSDGIHFTSSSGDVSFENVSGPIDVHTSSGDVKIKNSSGLKKLHSSSGDFSIQDAKGDIATESSSGDQDFQNIDGQLTAESSSGDVKINTQKGGIKIETSSGEISGRDIEIKGTAFFSSGSGDINIDVTNPIESLSFDLSSSSGDITVGAVHSEKRLSMGRGENSIKGKSSSGDQTYR